MRENVCSCFLINKISSKEDAYQKDLLVYIAMGITMNGMTQVLDFYIGEPEASKYWLIVHDDLKDRGIKIILVMVSNYLAGISQPIKIVLQILTFKNVLWTKLEIVPSMLERKIFKSFAIILKKYKAWNLNQPLNGLDYLESKRKNKCTCPAKS